MCEIAKGTQLVICSLEVCEGSCRGNSLSLLDNIRWNEERDDSIHVSYLHIIVIDLCIEGGILLVKVEERDPSKHVTLHVVKVKDWVYAWRERTGWGFFYMVSKGIRSWLCPGKQPFFYSSTMLHFNGINFEWHNNCWLFVDAILNLITWFSWSNLQMGTETRENGG